MGRCDPEVSLNHLLTQLVPSADMPSLSLPDRLIWFAHCPKAGGTSVEQFMVARWGPAVGHLHWGWDLWWRRGGWRVADPPNSPQHLTWRDALQQLPDAPDTVFAVVRDPVARMASEYRWQRHGRRGTRMGKLLSYLPFSVWLRLMLAAADRNPHSFDNHFRPQDDFVPETARVFRLEDGLDVVAVWLAEMAGEPLEPGEGFPHMLSTRERTAITEDDCALIGAVYAADFTRFGYSLPSCKRRSGRADRLAGLVARMVVFLDRRGCL